MQHCVSPIYTLPIALGDSLHGIRSVMELVKPFQIEDIMSIPIDVCRPETPPKTTVAKEKATEKTPPIFESEFAMSDVHICMIEEQEIQELWISSILDDNDKPRFWLNALNVLEETNTIPSELEMWICLKTHVATKLAIAHGEKMKDTRTVKKIVLKELHNYLDIFNEKKAAQFPKRKPYNHKIETKPGFKPK